MSLTQYSYKLAAIKLVTPGKEHLEKHCPFPHFPRYLDWADRSSDADLAEKPFFPGLIQCMLHSDSTP